MKEIKTVGELVDILSTYKRDLPVSLFIMEAIYSINEVSLEDGFVGENYDIPTKIVCLKTPAEFPIYLP
jgi:hypothetical protein